MGNNAFNDSNIRGELNIPGTLTFVPHAAIYNSKFESLIINEGVTTFGINAFSNMTNLSGKDIVIPTTFIGGNASNWFSNDVNIIYASN